MRTATAGPWDPDWEWVNQRSDHVISPVTVRHDDRFDMSTIVLGLLGAVGCYMCS